MRERGAEVGAVTDKPAGGVTRKNVDSIACGTASRWFAIHVNCEQVTRDAVVVA